MNARRVAIHEAGHAVLAILYGRTIISGAIEQSSSTLGWIQLDSTLLNSIYVSDAPLSEANRGFLIEEIKIGWGGYAAEKLILGNFYPWHMNDMQRITAAKLRLGDNFPSAELLDVAVGELSTNREAVARVTEEMLARRYLTHERVKELVAQHGRDLRSLDP